MVTVRLLTSLTLACDAALPVKLRVAVVSLALVTTAVRPLGTLVTVAPASTCPLVPVKVSPISVMVRVSVIEPLLAVASARVAAL